MNPTFEPTVNRLPALRGCALIALIILVGCGKSHESRPTAAPAMPTERVQARKVESRQQTITEEVVGTVRAKSHATIEAKVSGRIDKLPIVLGQKVTAGQLLAHLDAAEITARLGQARAGFEQAERDWKRVSSLFEGQAATRSEYDTSDARLRMAKAAMAETQAMMDYVEVSAPFDGVVARKWVEVGDLASPGKPLIEIEDCSALVLEADVPEAIASRIGQGARMVARVDTRSEELAATVSEISPAVDPASRTFRVKLDLSPAAGLLSGQFARLLVPVGESGGLYVPAPALVERGQLEILFVVADQRARMRLVKTGKRLGNEVEILSGLDAGDTVVTEGASRLADGQPTEVK